MVDCEINRISLCSLCKSQNAVISGETLVAAVLACLCYTGLLPLQLYLLTWLLCSATCHCSPPESCFFFFSM